MPPPILEMPIIQEGLKRVAIRRTMGRPETLLVAQAKPETQAAITRAEKYATETTDANWEKNFRTEAESSIGNEAQLQATVDQITDPAAHQRAVEAHNRAIKFSKNGFDSLDPADKQVFRKMMKAKVLHNPQARAEFEQLKNELSAKGMSEDDILDDMIRTNELSGGFGNELSQIATKNKLPEDLAKAEEAKIAAEERAKTADRELQQENRRQETNNRKLEEYDVSKNGRKGNRLAELEVDESAAKGRLAKITSEIENCNGQIGRLDDQKARLERERNDLISYRRRDEKPDTRDVDGKIKAVDDEIKKVEQRRARLQQDQATENAKATELQGLRSEKKLLEEQAETHKVNIENLDSAKRIADEASARENGRFDLAKKLHDAAVEDLIRSFDQSISTVMDRNLLTQALENNQLIRKAQEESIRQLNEEAQRTDNEERRKKLEQRSKDEEEINERMWARYHPPKETKGIKAKINAVRERLPEDWGGKEKEPFNFTTDNERIENDFNLLFENPSDATVKIMTEVLRQTPTPEQISRYSSIITREVLRAYKVNVGEISKAHQEYMRHLPWYRVMVEDGLQYNEAYANEIQKLIGNEKVLDENGKPTDRAVRSGMGGGMALLTLLMGMQGLMQSVTADERRTA